MGFFRKESELQKAVGALTEQVVNLEGQNKLLHDQIQAYKDEQDKYWDMFDKWAEKNMKPALGGTASEWLAIYKPGSSTGIAGNMTKFAVNHEAAGRIPAVVGKNGRLKAPWEYWAAVYNMSQKTLKDIARLTYKG